MIFILQIDIVTALSNHGHFMLLVGILSNSGQNVLEEASYSTLLASELVQHLIDSFLIGYRHSW